MVYLLREGIKRREVIFLLVLFSFSPPASPPPPDLTDLMGQACSLSQGLCALTKRSVPPALHRRCLPCSRSRYSSPRRRVAVMALMLACRLTATSDGLEGAQWKRESSSTKPKLLPKMSHNGDFVSLLVWFFFSFPRDF